MIIVIDTNILLHCKPLHEFNWLTFFEAKTIEVVLCSTVLEELDEKKNDPAMSDRAKSADRMLRQYEQSKDKIDPGVTLRFEESDSISDAQNDTKILQCARRLAMEENSSVLILTNDSTIPRSTFSKLIATIVNWRTIFTKCNASLNLRIFSIRSQSERSSQMSGFAILMGQFQQPMSAVKCNLTTPSYTHLL